MKHKLKRILFIFVIIFLIISIFEVNISSVNASINKLTNEQIVENEKINKHKEKIIYLTVDDGPSYKVTNKVLDILKENEVQAVPPDRSGTVLYYKTSTPNCSFR